MFIKQAFQKETNSVARVLILFLSLFSFVCAFFVLYFVIKKIHHQKFISIITSRTSIDWKRIFLSFGVWSMLSLLVFFGT